MVSIQHAPKRTQNWQGWTSIFKCFTDKVDQLVPNEFGDRASLGGTCLEIPKRLDDRWSFVFLSGTPTLENHLKSTHGLPDVMMFLSKHQPFFATGVREVRMITSSC